GLCQDQTRGKREAHTQGEYRSASYRDCSALQLPVHLFLPYARGHPTAAAGCARSPRDVARLTFAATIVSHRPRRSRRRSAQLANRRRCDAADGSLVEVCSKPASLSACRVRHARHRHGFFALTARQRRLRCANWRPIRDSCTERQSRWHRSPVTGRSPISCAAERYYACPLISSTGRCWYASFPYPETIAPWRRKPMLTTATQHEHYNAHGGVLKVE